MNNEEIADIFNRIALLMEIKGENRFKIQAYQRASDTLRSSTDNLELLSQQEIKNLPGIGSALADKIRELLTSGKLGFLENLEQEVPPSLIELLKVPGLGPKRVALLWKELGITTLSDLQEAAKAEKLKDLPGIGEKSEQRILTEVKTYKQNSQKNQS